MPIVIVMWRNEAALALIDGILLDSATATEMLAPVGASEALDAYLAAAGRGMDHVSIAQINPDVENLSSGLKEHQIAWFQLRPVDGCAQTRLLGYRARCP